MEKILLFNVDIMKTAKLKALLQPLAIECITVAKADQSNTIGELLAGKGKHHSCSNPFEEELVVFCNISQLKLDALLELLKNSCSINYKAIVTKHNMKWSAISLMMELRKERERLG